MKHVSSGQSFFSFFRELQSFLSSCLCFWPWALWMLQDAAYVGQLRPDFGSLCSNSWCEAPKAPNFGLWRGVLDLGFWILNQIFEDCARRPGSADNQFTNHLLNSWDIQVCDLLRKDLNESKKDVAGFCFAAANDIFDENRNLSPVFDICCSSGLRGRKRFSLLNVLILSMYGGFTTIWVV